MVAEKITWEENRKEKERTETERREREGGKKKDWIEAPFLTYSTDPEKLSNLEIGREAAMMNRVAQVERLWLMEQNRESASDK